MSWKSTINIATYLTVSMAIALLGLVPVFHSSLVSAAPPQYETTDSSSQGFMIADGQTYACIDVDPNAGGLPAGTIVTNAFPGVTITTNSSSNPPILFDSANPTGGDWDLGTPNEDFGGPGRGSGGEAGTWGANSQSLGMLFIISERSDTSNPDDNARGGVMTFEYDSDTILTSIDFVDADDRSQPLITLYNGANSVIYTGASLTPGDNSYHRLTIDDGDATPGVSGVRKAVITFPGSGAIAMLHACEGTPTAIGGKVWDDTNRDGLQDSNEPPIGQVAVTLHDSEDNLITTTTTDGDGTYVFDANNLPNGLTSYTTYRLKIDLTLPVLGGKSPTLVNVDNGSSNADEVDSDAVESDGFALIDFSTKAAGENQLTHDFGFSTFSASIGGEAWSDLDGSGIQDPTMPLLEGVAVTLYNNGNHKVAETTTDNGGTYLFDGLPAGNYVVEFIPNSSSLALTLKDQGTDEALDSDANVSTRRTDIITIGDATAAEIDAGFIRVLPGYAPVIINPGDQRHMVWSNVNLILSAIDNLNDTVTFSAQNLPPGLSIDSDGQISGTPTTSGYYEVEITANSTSGGPGSIGFVWRIVDSYTLNCDQQTGSMEAEWAQLTGQFATAVLPDQASHGQHIVVPNGTGNQWNGAQEADKALFCFQVATTGRYRLVGTVKATSDTNNSFYVKVNGQPENGYLWDTAVSDTYLEDYVNHRGSADPVELILSAGPNMVTVHLREDGTQLDNMALELVEATSTSVTCGGLVQEAEAGHLSGDFQLYADSNASNSIYIQTPDGIGHNWNGVMNAAGAAEYCFDVTESGSYQLVGSVAASASKNSFYVTVNGQPSDGYLWDIPLNNNQFTDVAMSQRNGPNPVLLNLDAGQHSIKIYKREAGTRLDKLSLIKQSASAGTNVNAAATSQTEHSLETSEIYLDGVLTVDTSHEAEPILADREITLVGDQTYEATTDVTGHYYFDDVVPGSYTLAVEVANSQSGETAIVEQSITVEDGTATTDEDDDDGLLEETSFEYQPPAEETSDNGIYLPLISIR